MGESTGGAATLTLNDVTLRANSAQDGAGVATDAAGASLTLNRVSVLDNFAAAGNTEGGGVNERFGGTVAINNSLIRGNRSDFATAVVDDGGGTIAITDSIVTENVGTGIGSYGAVVETGGGTVTITRSTISKNTAASGAGVSEDGGGTVTIVDSTISENTADVNDYGDGGGVQRDGGGTVTIRGSTIVGNTAKTGAGIQNYGGGGGFDVTNTTISGNRATARGGGIQANGTGGLSLNNVTVRNNEAGAGGTEIDNCSAAPSCSGAQHSVTLRNTIVAGGGTNCFGAITSAGHNLDSGNTCGFGTTGGNKRDTDPLLGPLANNGGPTMTHAELDGSPAIDAGDPATCPAVDQRGIGRPQGAACDIGAFERATASLQCSDGVDNDGDGGTDYPADQGCEFATDDSEAPDVPPCSDRLDNDGDGRSNFPADQGCESATDASESPDPAQCFDRLDNDGDGRVNFPADQGCASANDDSEGPDPSQCSDRLDNDGDGRVNFPADPDCESAADDDETASPPDTIITSGPIGLSPSAPWRFDFLVRPTGTFECKLDNAPFAFCTRPATYYALPDGAHTFSVRAVGPTGAVDPTPAERRFIVGKQTITRSCSGSVPFGDSASLTRNFSLGGVECAPLNERCPDGSICELTLVSGVTDRDRNTPWNADGSVSLDSATKNAGDRSSCYSTPEEEEEGDKLFYEKFPQYRPKPCSQTATTSALGPRTARAACDISRSFYGSGYHGRGPDDARRMTCIATLEIRPAKLFAVVAEGESATASAGTLAPGPGRLSITTPAVRAGTAKRKRPRARPPIAPIRMRVKQAGVVRFPLKLSPAAKRTYRRSGKLKLRLRVAFTPTSGKATVRTQRLTLVRPTPRTPVRRVPRTRDNLFPD